MSKHLTASLIGVVTALGASVTSAAYVSEYRVNRFMESDPHFGEMGEVQISASGHLLFNDMGQNLGGGYFTWHPETGFHEIRGNVFDINSHGVISGAGGRAYGTESRPFLWNPDGTVLRRFPLAEAGVATTLNDTGDAATDWSLSRPSYYWHSTGDYQPIEGEPIDGDPMILWLGDDGGVFLRTISAEDHRWMLWYPDGESVDLGPVGFFADDSYVGFRGMSGNGQLIGCYQPDVSAARDPIVPFYMPSARSEKQRIATVDGTPLESGCPLEINDSGTIIGQGAVDGEWFYYVANGAEARAVEGLVSDLGDQHVGLRDIADSGHILAVLGPSRYKYYSEYVILEPAAYELDIDVAQPGGRFITRGTVPVTVTIHSSPVLDASAIDLGSLRLGKAEPWTWAVHWLDADSDGDTDLRVTFGGASSGASCSAPVVELTGRTANGQRVHAEQQVDPFPCFGASSRFGR